MKNMLERLEQLRADAAECQLIADLATEGGKRRLFQRLADQMRLAAAEIGKTIAQKE